MSLEKTIYDPTYTDPRAKTAREGNGVMEAKFYVMTTWCGETPILRYVTYEYKEVEPDYFEIWVSIPELKNPCALDEDIRIAFAKEHPNMKIQTINYL